jgi:hypothetical protein
LRERSDYSLPALTRLGVCGGAMLATRLDLSAVFVAAATLYLSGKRPAALWALPLFAAVSVWLRRRPSGPPSPALTWPIRSGFSCSG